MSGKMVLHRDGRVSIRGLKSGETIERVKKEMCSLHRVPILVRYTATQNSFRVSNDCERCKTDPHLVTVSFTGESTV